MRVLLAAALVLAPLLGALAQGTGELRGSPRVIDGNRPEVDGVTVRLVGIRAPEPGNICSMGGRPYDCGHIAATALMDLTAGVEIRRALSGVGAENPPLARCYDPHGFCPNRNLVYTG